MQRAPSCSRSAPGEADLVRLEKCVYGQSGNDSENAADLAYLSRRLIKLLDRAASPNRPFAAHEILFATKRR